MPIDETIAFTRAGKAEAARVAAVAAAERVGGPVSAAQRQRDRENSAHRRTYAATIVQLVRESRWEQPKPAEVQAIKDGMGALGIDGEKVGEHRGVVTDFLAFLSAVREHRAALAAVRSMGLIEADLASIDCEIVRTIAPLLQRKRALGAELTEVRQRDEHVKLSERMAGTIARNHPDVLPPWLSGSADPAVVFGDAASGEPR
jgi:hypothetical protein